MGRSNQYIIPFYYKHIEPKNETALLGFSENSIFHGDLYDLSIGNWNINKNWKLKKKYDTIICTRCAYFSKDLKNFFKKCYEHLNENGNLYVDFGLGDHWRFDNYKIGWVKDGEQEYAYEKDNYLWSTIWKDSFLEHPHYKLFSKRVEKFGYNNVKSSIFKEVPEILLLDNIKKFDIQYDMITLWEDLPQLYILVKGKKK